MDQADVLKTPMTELNCDLAVAQAIALIKSYSFEMNGSTAEKLVQKWLNNYQGNWIRLAAIEALYLGRYKTVSIEQIMEVWLRIGTPNIHFKGEFERLICCKLPQHLVISDSSVLFTSKSSPQAKLGSLDNKLTKTLSEVKNSLKQGTGNKERGARRKEQRRPGRQTLTKRGDKGNETPGKCDSPLPSSEAQTQLSDNYHCPRNSPTITNFHPILDNSSFFDKLKSLAINSD